MNKCDSSTDIILLDTRTLTLEDYVNYLLPNELRGLDFTHNSEIRRMQILSHGVRRKCLATWLQCDPLLIHFENNFFGKPRMLSLNANYKPPFFNISHAGHWLLMGISERYEIGVDIERAIDIDHLSIAREFFHPLEIRQLEEAQNAADLKNLFFRLWAYKEAFVKAIGHGLNYDLDQFAVKITTGGWLDVEEIYKNSELKPLVLEQLGHEYFAAQCLIY